MITPTVLASGTGTGAAVSFTVPANTTWNITASNFANTTAGGLVVTAVSINDGTADRLMFGPKTIGANADYQPPSLQGATLKAGNILKINAVAGIDFHVSGLVIT